MALDQSALIELLEMMRSADAGELMRRLLGTIMQEFVDAEATAFIGAGPHERTDKRVTQRHGTRDKTVTTATGDLTIKIPKVRTRSEVRRICARLDGEVAAWRTRPLDEQAFPYVFLDATYCKVRIKQRVVSHAVVIATGVSADGRRRVLGCAVGDNETEGFWTGFLRDLRDRGLGGVQVVISDSRRCCLTNAITVVLQGSSWQGCGVHYAQRSGQGQRGPQRDGRREDPHELRPARPGPGP